MAVMILALLFVLVLYITIGFVNYCAPSKKSIERVREKNEKTIAHTGIKGSWNIPYGEVDPIGLEWSHEEFVAWLDLELKKLEQPVKPPKIISDREWALRQCGENDLLKESIDKHQMKRSYFQVKAESQVNSITDLVELLKGARL